MVKRCCDCGWYVPGGGENNCTSPNKKRSFHNNNVCALKEACESFKDREESEDLSGYPKIDLRPKIKARRFKTDKQ